MFIIGGISTNQWDNRVYKMVIVAMSDDVYIQLAICRCFDTVALKCKDLSNTLCYRSLDPRPPSKQYFMFISPFSSQKLSCLFKLPISVNGFIIVHEPNEQFHAWLEQKQFLETNDFKKVVEIYIQQLLSYLMRRHICLFDVHAGAFASDDTNMAH